jgi:hypothetical protein
MKDVLSFIAVGIALWLACLSVSKSHSEEIVEMVMASETGEIVLTKEPCEYIKMGLKGYPYAAYATEKGHANHEGCWKTDVVDRFAAILVYFPEIDATAVYNPKLFKPRNKNVSVPPNVFLDPKFEQGRAMFYGVYTF